MEISRSNALWQFSSMHSIHIIPEKEYIFAEIEAYKQGKGAQNTTFIRDTYLSSFQYFHYALWRRFSSTKFPFRLNNSFIQIVRCSLQFVTSLLFSYHNPPSMPSCSFCVCVAKQMVFTFCQLQSIRHIDIIGLVFSITIARNGMHFSVAYIW